MPGNGSDEERTAKKSAGDAPPWIFGFRPRMEYDHVFSALGAVLLENYDAVTSGAKTLEAEKKLGIAHSWYWYVARSDPNFGQFIIAFTFSRAMCGADERGVCPFDTGGLWHGHIATNGSIHGDRRRLFEEHDKTLGVWHNAFAEYVRRNYADSAQYARGLPPQMGIKAIVCTHPPNDPPAWTWEARIPKALVKDRVTIRALYCTAEERRQFANWLHRGPYDVTDAIKIQRAFSSVVVEYPDSVQVGVVATERIEAALATWLDAT